jgi:hypothetical protein
MSNTKLNYIQVGDQTYNIGGTGGSANGGYPVVTVEDNFNIEAEPNTFYNIKNNVDSEVSINFKPEEFYTTGKNKHIMFTWDNFNPEDLISIASYIGGIVVEDNSIEGYKYRLDVDASTLGAGIVPVYLSDNITEGGNIRAYTNILEEAQILELNNMHIINKDIDYLYYISITIEGTTVVVPHIILEEVENDSEFKYKYKHYGLLNILFQAEYLYTNEPIDTTTSIFINNADNYTEFPIANKVLNKDIKPSNIANEFVFNFNSPANIIFNQKIKWNNNSTPDLTKTGICTISIVNGVGCYTFI